MSQTIFLYVLKTLYSGASTCDAGATMQYWNDVDFKGSDVPGGQSVKNTLEDCMNHCIADSR